MKLSQYPLHLFDIDDTLINTTHAYQSALLEILVQEFPQLLQLYAKKELFSTISLLKKTITSLYPSAIIQATLYNYGIKVENNTIKKLASLFKEYFLKLLQPYQNIILYLKKLLENNVELGIISNGYRTQSD